jgi:hypothetical protein
MVKLPLNLLTRLVQPLLRLKSLLLLLLVEKVILPLVLKSQPLVHRLSPLLSGLVPRLQAARDWVRKRLSPPLEAVTKQLEKLPPTTAFLATSVLSVLILPVALLLLPLLLVPEHRVG